MTQCPVPAIPQPPAFIVFPEMSFTDEQVAEFRRQLAADLARPLKTVVMPAEPEITVTRFSAWQPVAVNEDGVPLSHGEPMVEVAPGQWMDATERAILSFIRENWHDGA